MARRLSRRVGVAGHLQEGFAGQKSGPERGQAGLPAGGRIGPATAPDDARGRGSLGGQRLHGALRRAYGHRESGKMPLSDWRLVKYTTAGRLFRCLLIRIFGRLQPLLLMAYDSSKDGSGLKAQDLSP